MIKILYTGVKFVHVHSQIMIFLMEYFSMVYFKIADLVLASSPELQFSGLSCHFSYVVIGWMITYIFLYVFMIVSFYLSNFMYVIFIHAYVIQIAFLSTVSQILGTRLGRRIKRYW